MNVVFKIILLQFPYQYHRKQNTVTTLVPSAKPLSDNDNRQQAIIIKSKEDIFYLMSANEDEVEYKYVHEFYD